MKLLRSSRFSPHRAPRQPAAAVPPTPPPAENQARENNASRSFTSGNRSYNTDKRSFWECSTCTFPNPRTEASCKGCGSAIPPGMLLFRPTYQQQPPNATVCSDDATLNDSQTFNDSQKKIVM